MNLQLVRMYGVLIGALAVMGMFVSGHLLGLTNSDPAFDTLRAVLAAILLYVGFGSRDSRAVDTALLGVGLLYVGMGIVGLFAPTLGGLLPAGLTGFDVAFHLLTGIVAIAAGARRHEHLAART